MQEDILQFQPFTGVVNVTFWYELARRKLNLYKLSEDPITIEGEYNLLTATSQLERENKSENSTASFPAQFYLEAESFEIDRNTPQSSVCRSRGTLYNTNTSESFKKLDTAVIFDKIASQVIHQVIRLLFIIYF
jgi:hypothetical protein